MQCIFIILILANTVYVFPGIFSAGLSTISAAQNSLAAVTLEDYMKPLYKKWVGHEFSPTKSASMAKVLAFTFGIISIALAFLAQFLGGLLQVMLIIILRRIRLMVIK